MKITKIGKRNREYFEEMLRGLPLENGTALGIIEDDKAVGCGLVNSDEASIEISYIFIDPSYRRKGLAKAFVEEMKSLAAENDKDALVAFPNADKETEAFLSACGFVFVQDTQLYGFKTKDFYESNRMRWMLKKGAKKKSVHLDKLDPRMRKRLILYCRKYSFDKVLLDKQMYDRNISFVSIDGEDITAVLLAKRNGAGEAYITMLANFRRTYSGIVSVLANFTAVLYKEGKVEDVYFLDRSGIAVKLLKKILPSKSRIAKKGACSTAILSVNRAQIPSEVK